jgi:hypothetical protein
MRANERKFFVLAGSDSATEGGVQFFPAAKGALAPSSPRSRANVRRLTKPDREQLGIERIDPVSFSIALTE